MKAIVSPTRISPKIYVEFVTPGEKWVEDLIPDNKIVKIKPKSAKRASTA